MPQTPPPLQYSQVVNNKLINDEQIKQVELIRKLIPLEIRKDKEVGLSFYAKRSNPKEIDFDFKNKDLFIQKMINYLRDAIAKLGKKGKELQVTLDKLKTKTKEQQVIDVMALSTRLNTIQTQPGILSRIGNSIRNFFSLLAESKKKLSAREPRGIQPNSTMEMMSLFPEKTFALPPNEAKYISKRLDNIFNPSTDHTPPKATREKVLFCIRERGRAQFIADELYEISKSLFLEIPPEEFAKKKDRIHIENLIAESTGLSLKIEKDIVEQPDSDAMVFAMERWIMVLKNSFDKEDFHTVMAVLAALKSTPVARLFDDTDGGLKMALSNAARQQLDKISNICKSASQRQPNTQKNGIPSIGDYIGHIARSSEGNHKLAAIADITAKVVDRQSKLVLTPSAQAITETDVPLISSKEFEANQTKLLNTSRAFWKKGEKPLKAGKIVKSLEKDLWETPGSQAIRKSS